MTSTHNSSTHAILRAVVVSGSGLILGFILYRSLVFTPTMKAFQFTVNSVTIGVAYAGLKSSSTRNGFAALFVWYVLLTAVIGEFNSWLPILSLAYIVGMASATFVHQRAVKMRLLRGAIQRIVAAGAIIAIANALIVVFLALFSLKVAVSHASRMMETIYHNLQLGALIGLATGLGMELAEYLNRKFIEHQNEIDDDKPMSNSVAN